MGPAAELDGVRFGYVADAPVLDVPRMTIGRGERWLVHGSSGCGKTTLLGLLAGVLRPQAGSVRVLGRDLTAMSGTARDAFRAEHVGYVFQQFNLIPYLSVIDNVTLPCRLSRARRDRLTTSPEAAARDLVRRLELDGLVDRPVRALSVGQQQRVAVARALVGTPELVIADEPTSALDPERRDRFVELLLERCSALGSTLVVVSHDRELAPAFSHQMRLSAPGEER